MVSMPFSTAPLLLTASTSARGASRKLPWAFGQRASTARCPLTSSRLSRAPFGAGALYTPSWSGCHPVTGSRAERITFSFLAAQ